MTAVTAEPPPDAASARAAHGLLVCADCGQVHTWAELAPGHLARCCRCDAVMARGHRLGASALLALTIAAAVLLLIATTAPLMSIRLAGQVVAATLPMAILAAWRDGAPLVAGLAAFSAVLAPAVFIGLRLWLLLPLAAGRTPAGLGTCLRLAHAAAHWNTVSVLAVGALLALVRMAAMSQVSVGAGLLAIGGLSLLLAAIESAGLRHLWPADAGERE